LAGEEVRHPDGDFVTFRETMPFWRVEAMRVDIGDLGEGFTTSDVLGLLSELYLVHGIESWTLQDAKGEPLPVNRATVTATILPRYDVAADLAEVADALYTAKVVLPLVARGSTSLPRSPMDDSTSRPSTDSIPSSVNGKRSKPSSISTTPTGDTVTTSESPDGGSNLSPSKASAA